LEIVAAEPARHIDDFADENSPGVFRLPLFGESSRVSTPPSVTSAFG
jgi:hypothetical protein